MAKTTAAPALSPSQIRETLASWGGDLRRNLAPRLSTEDLNHIHTAIEDLTDRLAPISPKEA